MRPSSLADRPPHRLRVGDKSEATNSDTYPPLQSRELLLGGRVRTIEHADQRYFLRLTRNGKLILSK